MNKLHANVFDHSGYKHWDMVFKIANETFALAGIEIVPTIIQRDFQIKWGKWDGTKHRVDYSWFKETFSKPSEGKDFAIAVYSYEQSNSGGKNSLNGQSIEKNYGVSEVWLRYKEGRTDYIGDGHRVIQLVKLIIHECGHGLADHILGNSSLYDKVHVYDHPSEYDDKGNLIREERRELRDFFRYLKPHLETYFNNMINWNSDEDILTRTLVGEYGHGSYEDMFAVGCVIRNRAYNRNGFASTIRGACLQPFQFSCWNHGTPDRERLLNLPTNSRLYAEANKVAKDILAGNKDITRNADHYLNIEVTKSLYGKIPNWVDPSRKTVIVGAHTFYNLQGKWEVEEPENSGVILPLIRLFQKVNSLTLPEGVKLVLLQLIVKEIKNAY